MLARFTSVLLIVALLGMLTPVWAEEAVTDEQPGVNGLQAVENSVCTGDPSIPAGQFSAMLPGRPSLEQLLSRDFLAERQFTLMPQNGMLRDRFLDTVGQSTASGQSSGGTGLTRKGKILKFVGLGMLGAGGGVVLYGAIAKRDKTECTSWNYPGNSGTSCLSYHGASERKYYYAAGGVTAGAGLALMIVGMLMKE
jgi:hypothetical protein